MHGLLREVLNLSSTVIFYTVNSEFLFNIALTNKAGVSLILHDNLKKYFDFVSLQQSVVYDITILFHLLQ